LHARVKVNCFNHGYGGKEGGRVVLCTIIGGREWPFRLYGGKEGRGLIHSFLGKKRG